MLIHFVTATALLALLAPASGQAPPPPGGCALSSLTLRILDAVAQQQKPGDAAFRQTLQILACPTVGGRGIPVGLLPPGGCNCFCCALNLFIDTNTLVDVGCAYTSQEMNELYSRPWSIEAEQTICERRFNRTYVVPSGLSLTFRPPNCTCNCCANSLYPSPPPRPPSPPPPPPSPPPFFLVGRKVLGTEQLNSAALETPRSMLHVTSKTLQTEFSADLTHEAEGT